MKNTSVPTKCPRPPVKDSTEEITREMPAFEGAEMEREIRRMMEGGAK